MFILDEDNQMFIARVLLFIGFLSAQTAHAQVTPNHCDVIYLNNYTEQTLELSGSYPDNHQKFNEIILKPYETQQSFALESIGSCQGNTSLISCHARVIFCHENVDLILKNSASGDILLSGRIHTNDTLSINKCPTCDKPLIVMVNDIPFTNES